MSIGGKKEKSKSTTVSTPDNPAWVTSSLQGFTGGLDQLSRTDPTSYVAKANPLLQRAQGAAMGLNLGQGGTTPAVSSGGGKDPFAPEINGGGGDGYAGKPATAFSPGGNNAFGDDYFGLGGQLAYNAGTAGPNLADARGYRSGGYEASGASARTFNQADLQGILNPFLDDVVNTSLADYDAGAGANRSRMASAAANNGGLRNSNNAIRSAVFDAESDRGRGALAADTRFRAYNDAAGILGQDSDRLAGVSVANAGFANDAARFGADAYNSAARYGADAFNQNQQFNAGQRDSYLARALSAAGVLGGLGTAQGQDVRANIGLLGDLGGQQQEIDQATAQAPLTLQQILGGLYGNVPYGLFNGSTVNQTGSGSSMGFSADLSKLMGMMPKSDVRAKVDIVPLGEGPNGVPSYEFSYADDPQRTRYIGPMAQEVAQAYPETVGQAPDGMMTVDYNALGFPTPDQQDQSGASAMRTRAAVTGGQTPANDPYPLRRKRGLFGGR